MCQVLMGGQLGPMKAAGYSTCTSRAAKAALPKEVQDRMSLGPAPLRQLSKLSE